MLFGFDKDTNLPHLFMKNFGVRFVNLLCNSIVMKHLRIFVFIGLLGLLFSCKDDEAARIAETKRTQKVNDSILGVIDRNWKFNVTPAPPKVAAQLGNWNEWQQFNNELQQKPTGTLDAYRRKVNVLSSKVDGLVNNIPATFNKPQVRSRIAVLITQVKQLQTFIGLETIPDKKVVSLIHAVADNVNSAQVQFDEIIRFSEIPKEEGEEQMIRALDTTRLANPDMMPPQTQGPAPAGHGAGYLKQ